MLSSMRRALQSAPSWLQFVAQRLKQTVFVSSQAEVAREKRAVQAHSLLPITCHQTGLHQY
jgi:hypothetical protein